MANLEMIRQMRLKYDYKFRTDADNSIEYGQLTRKDYFEKAFDTRAFQNIQGDYEKYFLSGAETNVSLLFIDVCNFSIMSKDWPGDSIGRYFDRYYGLIIPIIYKYGGEIDKIMGDGIIAVFGQPFINASPTQCFEQANNCAKQIIFNTRQSDYVSKVAFHNGKIKYFKNKSTFYNEYTIIGQPLTELFRLESVSVDNAINFYQSGPVRICYDEMIKSRDYRWTGIGEGNKYMDERGMPWSFSVKTVPKLNGVKEEPKIVYMEDLLRITC
ncbi:adenylate/guanylate cyclase domain-containing protein [Chitinophaga rhizophila]|uniref:Adenylate/guanylate cyclase domain-containing protein n=1 Tax=Chitinophaga rhizophila TaxID=2866212 RepID=A0ABS7GJ59_9BACT|nr:adenylate/guanylate cyclase domain-containing protein [Chitinophaga rhizophila]MBW8687255.1 adenylate/guanylate cyclase domain-containing protein [Chitinophaga rhizophila]